MEFSVHLTGKMLQHASTFWTIVDGASTGANLIEEYMKAAEKTEFAFQELNEDLKFYASALTDEPAADCGGKRFDPGFGNKMEIIAWGIAHDTIPPDQIPKHIVWTLSPCWKPHSASASDLLAGLAEAKACGADVPDWVYDEIAKMD